MNVAITITRDGEELTAGGIDMHDDAPWEEAARAVAWEVVYRGRCADGESFIDAAKAATEAFPEA